jgi:hypothetical protein
VREHWREIDGIRRQASHEVEERARWPLRSLAPLRSPPRLRAGRTHAYCASAVFHQTDWERPAPFIGTALRGWRRRCAKRGLRWRTHSSCTQQVGVPTATGGSRPSLWNLRVSLCG